MTIKDNAIGSEIDIAKKVLEVESRALSSISEKVNDSFSKAIELIAGAPGKVVICGMGKSGHVAQKMTSTFCSVGVSSVYLHPSEAVHGDLGVYQPGDPTIVLSKSGTTAEVVRLLPILKDFNSPIIALVSNVDSPIAKAADVVLDLSIDSEADPLGIVPTSSAVAAMAMGDAIAAVLMNKKGFKPDDFAQLHPAGQLGRNLTLKVEDVMHGLDEVACVNETASLKEVVTVMTDKPMGAACVVDSNNALQGLITDGDIRRLLLELDDLSQVTAKDVMTCNPIQVSAQETLDVALKLMECRKSQLSVLPVTDDQNKSLLGLIRVHDIYQPA